MADSIVSARFWARVQKTDSCWVWQGTTNFLGYGTLKIDRKRTQSHRFAYEELVGPIPDGLVLDHLCRNPPCVNPSHLEPVTVRENTNRSPLVQAMRNPTHCKRGHELVDGTWEVYREGKGRRCRLCKNQRAREYNRRKYALSKLPPPPVTECGIDTIPA